MNKYTLIRQKGDQAIAKRQTKISRRTFPSSIFQLNSIIAPEVAPPDIITEIEFAEEEEEVIIQDQPIEEPIILLPENQLEAENAIIESPIEIKPDVVDLVILSQSEDIRKLLLLKETIKRVSKKKITV